nr:endonuclease [Pseudomarimonas arenosa]
MRLLSLALLLSLPGFALAQSVSLGQSVVSESFDSLTASGTGSSLPNGWYAAENGSVGADYSADNGSANSGSVYSYGSTASSERALGTLASNSTTPLIGVQIQNDTGAVLTEFGFAFRGEQWRLGATGRAEQLGAEISTNATSLTDSGATWTTLSALSFVGPTSSGTVGALDGNASANQTQISTQVSGISVPVGATLWLRWVDVNVGGSDDGLAIDDVVITPPGGGVDLPPELSSSTPTNGAIEVDPAANLALQFSEPVTLGGSAISLSCASTPQAFVVTGGSRNYTLSPTSALPFSSSCELHVEASQVTDQDGDPDQMQSDYTAAFTTADPPPDLPPTVASTLPTANAGNVALNSTISIAFSEAVSLADSWFAISCSVSSAHGAIVSGGPISYVLTPDAAFEESETCTVTVFATQVQDQDGTPDLMVANYEFSFGTTIDSSNYYASIDASSQANLRSTLHARIRNHTAYPYSGSGTSTWTILEQAEQDPANPDRILDVYRNCSYAKGSDRDGQSGSGASCTGQSGLKFNREHSWPNSLGFGSQTGSLGLPNAPYTDTHMLFLTDKNYNADRGNKPFDDCLSGCSQKITASHGSTGGGGSAHGDSNWVRSPDGNAGSFEVWDLYKGDIARAMFYMDVRYEGGSDSNGQSEPDLVLTDNRSLIQATSSSPAYMGLLSTLLAWHQADPPSDRERARNEIVYSYQGNRNPFVDHPEWVACLFQNVCSVPLPNDVFNNGFENPPDL